MSTSARQIRARESLAGYGWAILLTVAAVAMRFVLAPWLKDLMPLAPLYAALVLSVWIGGLGPALIPAIPGYLACYYFFFAPFNSFGGWDTRNGVGFLLHLFTSASIILIGVSARAARRKLEEQQARLLESDEAARMARDRAETALAGVREAQHRTDEFLATLAHELRNPLAPIRNMVEVLKQDGDGTSHERARDIIERQTVHLIRLVDDLLDTSRITLGKLELRKERIELGAVINLALETNRPLMSRSGHTVSVTLPAGEVYLDADPVRLVQVFDNLLNNACKYTPAGGQIDLTADSRDGKAMIVVKDTGIGIPPQMLSGIFDIFVQVDGALNRSEGGLGLGLTLVRKLVEMHGGSVQARSAGINHGSEFEIRLPLAARQTEDRRAPTPAPATTVTPRRVLVVDDNRDAAESLAMILRLDGHDAQIAHDGPRALETAESFRPEVVFLDIGLPKMNGFEVCRRLRTMSGGDDIMVVALTGWGHDDYRERSREAGIDTHLVKPVKVAELKALLAR